MTIYDFEQTGRDGEMEKSELSAACQELEQKAAALEDALRAAEEANQAKSRFLSNMSHDIRTPVNAIVGLTTIGLSHIDEKARVQDCLRKIQTASAHLMSLVNDVLDMSRIDSGRMVLSQEEFSLADLIHDIAVIVRPQAVQKDQDLRLDIRGIDQERLVGDPLRLRQILVNIINNAVKYTQEAGRITVSFRQDPVRTSPQGERTALLRFACQDNGMGMSPEFLERIFLPFERVHTSQVSRIEGTGLGMSIVKNLVDGMGGQITVESREGEGSCFRVELPLPVSAQRRPPLALPAGQPVSVLADLRLIALFHGADETVAVGQTAGVLYLLIGGAGAGVADVVPHRVVEQEYLLIHQADTLQHLLQPAACHLGQCVSHGFHSI